VFHGTSESYVTSILSHGFVKNFNQNHVYGIGTYFATSPNLSHVYCSPNTQGIYTQLQCRMLVGDSVVNYNPSQTGIYKPGSTELYETFQNQEGTYLVATRDWQADPTYLIYYTITSQ